SWFAWRGVRSEDQPLAEFVRFLIGFRRNHSVLRPPQFLRGTAMANGLKDLAWFTADGREVEERDWRNAGMRSIAYLLGAEPAAASLLCLLHAGDAPLAFRVPRLPVELKWRPAIDTGEPNGLSARPRLFSAEETFSLGPKSLVLLSAAGDEP
ncbi:MAG: hypothetical protein ACREFQ_03990, partial [Stellaceae bacterium]